MNSKAVIACAAALVWAAPAEAQQRGTVEFGAFGSAATFDEQLSLKRGFGGGGRVGIFLEPWLAIEFEDAEMRATRPNGLRDVNVGILSGRLVAAPVQNGRLSFLVGAGAGVSTETNFLHSYGVDVLAGARLKVSDNAALRVDGVLDWLANENWKRYQSVRVGLSLFRHPARTVETVAAPMPAPMPMQMRDDSVSADETRRLRARDAALSALRDSLSRAPTTTAASRDAMEAAIYFAYDKSDLSAEARAVLDSKIPVFRANPSMTIVMVGHTDMAGTDAYNMALGTRRAEAAQSYLAARGIAASRVVIESKGKRATVTDAPGVAGQAPNRRAEFRLLMVPNVIVRP